MHTKRIPTTSPFLRALLICLLVSLVLWLIVSYTATQRGLTFDSYSSEEDWRIALLHQVPIGSSFKDVLDFLGGMGFREDPDPKFGADCGHYLAFPKSLAVSICDDWWSNGGRWLIEFRFDEQMKLKDCLVQ